MQKTKALLVMTGMKIGGIEASAVAFLQNMYKDIDVDLFLFSKSGTYLSNVPKEVDIYSGGKIANLCYKDKSSVSQQNGSKPHRLKSFLKRAINKIGLVKLLRKMSLLGQKKFYGYDVAICYYGTNEQCLKFSLKKVNAKKKVCIIHSDPTNVKLNRHLYKQIKQFDKIYLVSNSCASAFKNMYPELKSKTDFLYNFQNYDRIKEMSREFSVKYDKSVLNIVSASRFAQEKGIERSLAVFKRLHDEGRDFVWHILGTGELFDKISGLIKKNDMSSYIKLYGPKNNPFPYIASADLFYLGSYHESAGLVLSEAISLGVPVISTQTISSQEIVGANGAICENSEEGIYDVFNALFENRLDLSIKNREGINKNEQIKNKFLNDLKELLSNG